MLLDLKMPGMSGFELLAWIRRQPQLKNLRVVVLTASDEIRDATEAYRLGANSFLVKPVELETAQLFTTLRANGVTIPDPTPAARPPAPI